MMPFVEARELDRVALSLLKEDVDRLDEATLTLPIACEGWTVRDLLDHMNTEHTAICGGNVDHDGDPRFAFSAIADRWIAFFEATLGQTIIVPKIGVDLPSEVVLSVNFADMVVHSWDLATSVGSSSPIPMNLVEKAEEVAAVVTASGTRSTSGISSERDTSKVRCGGSRASPPEVECSYRFAVPGEL
jgi:uncharacterized protein (TIGR03086 family)